MLEFCVSLLVLFIIYLILNTEFVLKYTIGNFSETINPNGSLTNKGYLLQGIILVLSYGLIKYLLKA
jgi:hypothetical protein